MTHSILHSKLTSPTPAANLSNFKQTNKTNTLTYFNLPNSILNHRHQTPYRTKLKTHKLNSKAQCRFRTQMRLRNKSKTREMMTRAS